MGYPEGLNSVRFFRKQLHNTQQELSLERSKNEILYEALNRLGNHNPNKDECEVCKILTENNNEGYTKKDTVC